MLQPVGVAQRRAARSSCPDAQLNLMFWEGVPPPPLSCLVFQTRAPAAPRCRGTPSGEGARRHPSRRRGAFLPAAAQTFRDARPSPRQNIRHASAGSGCPAALHAFVPFACPIEPRFFKRRFNSDVLRGSRKRASRRPCNSSKSRLHALPAGHVGSRNLGFKEGIVHDLFQSIFKQCLTSNFGLAKTRNRNQSR
jgi:hypothetical protein